MASAGIAATKFELPALRLPERPEALRGSTNPDDTARLVALHTGQFGTQSARHVTAAAEQLASTVQAKSLQAAQNSEAQAKVSQFFTTLQGSSGRQTFVIQNQDELRDLLTKLSGYGYKQNEVLSLLDLPSVEALQHPVTLDLRDGYQMPILFPYNEALQMTAPQPAIRGIDVTAALPATSYSSQTTATSPAILKPSETYIVYRVQADEGLAEIAQRYGTTVEQIQADNTLASPTIAAGRNLLIRRPTAPITTLVAAVASSVRLDDSQIVSEGSFGTEVTSALAAMSAVSYGVTDGAAIVAHYGDTLFPDVDSMPPEARDYFLGTVQEVAAFFDVRPGDLMGIMRLEQNGAGWRLSEARVSSVGAAGVAQIVPRTWNGWANPERTDFVSNVLDIEEHGGLGFDWSKRNEWKAWQEGRADRNVLDDSNANPDLFENSVAGIARHLVHWGLTEEFAERDPAAFAARLGDAIAVYNSGRPLAQSAGWVQSAANQKTTGQYVAEAMAISEQMGELLGQPSVAVPLPGTVEAFQQHFEGLLDQTFGALPTDCPD